MSDEAPLLLVAHPDPQGRGEARELLERLGYRVHVCADADGACVVLDAETPDVVLLAAPLAVARDCRLLKEVKARAEQEFIPVIILADRDDESVLERCAECGADGFLLHPYRAPVVSTKLNTLIKDRRMHAQLREQARRLAFHQEMLARDYKIAENIFNSVARQRDINASNIRYFLSPMSVASGDIALAAQKPNGEQRILLGDFTGHGLAAAIGALPVSEIFRNMTTMGFPVGDMVKVMNRRLRELLPTGIFLAVALLEFDSAHMRARVWNGGLPETLVRRRDGRLERYGAENFPLAVVDSKLLGEASVEMSVEEGDRIYLYSDGVIEAVDANGELFGQERLDALIEASDGEGTVEHIRAELERFTAGCAQSDDITLIELSCSLLSDEEGYSVRP